MNPQILGTIWRERSRWLSLDNNARRDHTSKVIKSPVALANLVEKDAASEWEVSQECGEDDSRAKDDDELEAIQDYITYVKERLDTIGDARLSMSPYDTAWVALIKDINGHDRPQFPSSLEFIVQTQLQDGSWGDEQFFIATDRLVNTLACVVALKSWNVHADKIEKGLSFIRENLYQLENANAEHATCGFEIVFPALLQRAQKLGIDCFPYDDPIIQKICVARDQKLKRVPVELMHSVPTASLFSLEGFVELDWKKLLKLQAKDGSFLTSPSSTAFAFMETKDDKCLKFITNLVEKFNGGVPHSYPVDIFARLWAVDRLQRLGISRHFESQIKDFLNYVHRYWSTKGIFSARDAGFSDIDDTAMGFRLLRLQGYNVNPNVFENFRVGNKFSCYAGQMIESPSPIYSLYRASQLLFPGEETPEETLEFSYNFLKESLDSHNLLDKWVISKNLPDEIRCGLEIPWYSTIPRVETISYLGHYSGANEIWNGKAWYRMYDISNNEFLELAKLDFNKCQAQHRIEWRSMKEWYNNCNIKEFGISEKELLLAFFLATASIFEPEKSKERTTWAKSQIISKMMTYSFSLNENVSLDQKAGFLAEFQNKINARATINSDKRAQGNIDILVHAFLQSLEGFEEKIRHQLKDVWDAWLMKIYQGTTDGEEYAELYATILNICAGHISEEGILSHPEYKILSKLANKICHQLREHQNDQKVRHWTATASNGQIREVEQDMRRLVQLVLEESGSINRNLKQTFLLVAKTYYYSACVAADKTEIHISKVLFEPSV